MKYLVAVVALTGLSFAAPTFVVGAYLLWVLYEAVR